MPNSKILGDSRTGLVYEALVEHTCWSCDSTTLPQQQFTRSMRPGGGAGRTYPLCSACAPIGTVTAKLAQPKRSYATCGACGKRRLSNNVEYLLEPARPVDTAYRTHSVAPPGTPICERCMAIPERFESWDTWRREDPTLTSAATTPVWTETLKPMPPAEV